MAWNPREWWTQRRQELEQSKEERGGSCQRILQRSSALFMIPSVKEVAEATFDSILHEKKHGDTPEEEDRILKARACTDAGVAAGVKAGSYAAIAITIPTIAATRLIPWAKHNLNYTAQALIISATTLAAYFITTEKTILTCSRDASYARLEKEREAREVKAA